MANRKKTQRSSNIGMSILAVFLAIIVLAACTIGGLQLWGKDKVKPSNWFKDDTAIVTPYPDDKDDPAKDPDDKEQNDHDDASESHGMKMMAAKIPIELYECYGISPASVESAYTITATIEPDNATVKDVDWSVYFKNASSSWATGKTVTDYVTIQGTEGSCVVTCSQAFGEPIMVKVASHADSTIFATKQFDYVKRITNLQTLTFRIVTEDQKEDGFAPGNVVIATSKEDSKGAVAQLSQVRYSEGTVQGDVELENVTFIDINNFFEGYSKLDVMLHQANMAAPSANIGLNTEVTNYVINDPTKEGNCYIPWTTFFKANQDINQIPEKAKNILKSYIMKNAEEGPKYPFGCLASMKYTYKGTTVQERYISRGEEMTGVVTTYSIGITDLKFEDSNSMFF